MIPLSLPQKHSQTTSPKLLIIFSLLIILILAVPIKIQAKERDSFLDPTVCKNCHAEIYNQWKGSMHSSAFKDPIWQLTAKLFSSQVKSQEEILEAKACVKCHLAAGYALNQIKYSAHGYGEAPGAPENGVFCDFCHSIKASHGMGNGDYILDTEANEKNIGTKYGPYEDSKSDFHPSTYSKLHTRSEFCGICHNVFHVANLTPIESTYTEWKRSPYNTGNSNTSVHCQDCHMRQRPGIPATGSTDRLDNAGVAADGGPMRPHVATHYFVGGNISVSKLLGGDTHSKMAVERLLHAAKVEITEIPSSWKAGDLADVNIRVRNIGAGHYLPTGLTEVRQMWIAFTVTDSKGKIVYKSGALDKDKNIEEGAVIFNTVLGDAMGNPVVNVAMATHVLRDYRIPPKGYTENKFYFLIPKDAASPLHVRATLKYRSAPQKLVNDLLKDKTVELAVIDMAMDEMNVNLK